MSIAMMNDETLYNALCNYFAENKRYLEGRGSLPDPARIIAACSAQSSLRHPKPYYPDNGPYVAAHIEPPKGNPRQREPYRFDPWFFAIMLWLEAAGYGFRINTRPAKPSDPKLYYFINWRGANNHSLRRIIMGPETGKAVPDRGDYRDYRKIALRQMNADKLSAVTDYAINTPFRGRDYLIKFFEDRAALRKLAKRGIDPPEYLACLADWLTLADQMTDRYYGAPGGAR